MTLTSSRRRVLGATAGLAMGLPLAVSAQPAGGRPARIGFLFPGTASAAETRIAAMRDGMRAGGYALAAQAEVVARVAAGDPVRLPAMAAELVAAKVDLIVPVSPSAVRAAQAATTTIPVVAFDLESDPVASGFVASLARPGGNITGVFSDFPSFGTKWLELLKEALPHLARAVVLWDPGTGTQQLDAVQSAGRMLGVVLPVLEIRAMTELARVFDAAAAERPDAVIILSSPIFGSDPKPIADLALQHRFATATLFTEIARAGGLIGYGPNLLGSMRQAGTMVARVLAGARPAELPVERPTLFELVINLRTAKALGLTLPAALLLRADEVIE
ncbi:MAG: ABC transporter substrate-binding protein [Reyranellaceae bacterium]